MFKRKDLRNEGASKRVEEARINFRNALREWIIVSKEEKEKMESEDWVVNIIRKPSGETNAV